ncbi:MAG: HRDC domain-containing protein [Anaerolineae bacterium]|jgi:ribonuclease D
MNRLPRPSVITSPGELKTLLDDLSSQPAVAVDTESNSLHAYHERVCLIQFSTANGDYIVDPLASLDISPLGDLFADSTIQKVFHAAEQDVGWLKRDLGCSFASLFDTMWAARILGWPRVGLADVLEETFDVHTKKRYQRYDWGRRPLKPEAISYAQLDTHYLLPLRDLQMEALERTKRIAEAGRIFSQLEQTPPAAPPFGPEGFWRLKEADDLRDRERAVLWELYLWRDQVAREWNRPPFRVISRRTLVALARARPRRMEDLRRVRGVKRHHVRRYGRAILEAVSRGNRGPIPKLPPCQSREKAVRERYRALRAWRRGVSEGRGREPETILSNATLWALAERNPADMDELKDMEELKASKLRPYGPDILHVLRDGQSAS